jgi:outer membrane protein assembly factor BamB
MRKKIIGIFVCTLFITAVGLSTAETINERQTTFINNYDDSSKVLIELNLSGISYGQELLWKANTTGTNYEESVVTVIEGIAYIGSCSTHGKGHDTVFAVNIKTGEILWSHHTGPGYVGPIIDTKQVYYGTDSHGFNPENEYLYAFNRTTGNETWDLKVYSGIAESIQYDETNLYFASSAGVAYAVDKQNGWVKWTRDLQAGEVVTKPILKDQMLYFACFGGANSGTLFKLAADDGREIWKISLPGGPWDNSLTADGQGRIFLAIYGSSSISAYYESNGSLLWEYSLHAPPLSFNAYHNNIVFIADTEGYVYALSANNGHLIWETKIGDTCDISSPTLSGGLLFIGTRDYSNGAFYALNESNGAILWRYPIGASVTCPPSIVGGMMFCGSDGWNMYAFDFGIGNGDWLLHRYDSNNTAFSPNGLTEWQFVSASCTTVDNITTCTVTNTYDHYVRDVKLKLSDNITANWYNSTGLLLKNESNYYIIENLSSLSTLTFTITADLVHQPKKPTISGTSSGKIGKEYTYVVSAIDPSGSDLSYYIDWGDGTFTGWTSTIPSGEPLNISHTWNVKGSYIIKAKAKNIQRIESEWSDPLPITIPYVYNPILQFLELLFQRFPRAFPILRHLLG